LPAGDIHLRLELAALLLIVVGGLGMASLGELDDWSDSLVPLVGFVGAYLFSCLLLSPDLDLARSSPQNRWGPLRLLWRPYARLFRHRGLSHNLLFGPLSRILYLGVILATIPCMLYWGADIDMPWFEDAWKYLGRDGLWSLAIGLVLPNEIHIVADRFFSARRI
jgi:uncharacterized metal-binding protein